MCGRRQRWQTSLGYNQSLIPTGSNDLREACPPIRTLNSPPNASVRCPRCGCTRCSPEWRWQFQGRAHRDKFDQFDQVRKMGNATERARVRSTRRRGAERRGSRHCPCPRCGSGCTRWRETWPPDEHFFFFFFVLRLCPHPVRPERGRRCRGDADDDDDLAPREGGPGQRERERLHS